MAETTKYHLPYPSLSSIPNVPADFQKLAEAVEVALDASRTQQLNPSQYTVNTPISQYPMDVSLMALSSADAVRGQWPFGIAAQVITMSSASPMGATPNRATQFWATGVKASATTQPVGIFTRVFTASGWDPWWRLGPSVVNWADVVITKVNTNTSLTVKFPSYSFLQTPNIVCSVDENDPVNCRAGAGRPVSTTSVTLYAVRVNAVKNVRVLWHAVDQQGITLAAGLGSRAGDDPGQVEAVFSHVAGSACPEATLDPHTVVIPTEQTDWLGVSCAYCDTMMVQQP